MRRIIVDRYNKAIEYFKKNFPTPERTPTIREYEQDYKLEKKRNVLERKQAEKQRKELELFEKIIVQICLDTRYMIAVGKKKSYTFQDENHIGLEICRGTFNGGEAILAIDIKGSIPTVVIRIVDKPGKIQKLEFKVLGSNPDTASLIPEGHWENLKSYLVPELLNGLNSRLLTVRFRN